MILSNNKKRLIKKNSGFTLIELMIVVAIIGILTTVAYPSYVAQILDSKRATGTQSLLECAAILERRFTLNGTYTDDACDSLNNDDYVITVAVTGLTRPNRTCTSNGKENCFLITATTSFLDDTDCKTMLYNELGVKTAYSSSSSSNTELCWRST